MEPKQTVRSLVLVTVGALALLLPLVAAGTAGASNQRAWVRRHAYSDGNDFWTHIAAGPSGSVYVAGWGNAEAADERAMVARYTASGRRVWARTFAGLAGATMATGLAVDARGNAFVVGSERYPGTSEAHIFLMKLAADTGRRVWLKQYDGPAPAGHDSPRDVALGPGGAVYVAGFTTTVDSGFDALLIKYVDKGARAVQAWKRTLRNPSAPPILNADEARRVVVDGAGRVYWAGMSDKGTGKNLAFVRRVTPAGTTVWTDRITLEASDSLGVIDLELFPTGGVVVAGVRDAVAATGADTFVKRYTAPGQARFLRMLDSLHDEIACDLAVDPAGNIAVAGQLIDDATHHAAAWVVRGDTSFTGRWQRTYASSDPSQPAVFNALAASPAGALFCAGRVNVGFITGNDFTIIKYAASGARRWVDVYDDLDANRSDECHAVLYVGGDKPGVYGAGLGGATTAGEALLVKYRR